MSGHIINDPQADSFISIIEDTSDSDSYVTAMLEIDSIFNADLIRHDVVVKTIKSWYRQIEADGIDACLRIAAKEV
jgi:mannitol-1-phosphate/altronate dehydrogenase